MAAPRAKPPSKPVQARTVSGRQIMLLPCGYGMNRSIFIILNRNILSSTFFSPVFCMILSLSTYLFFSSFFKKSRNFSVRTRANIRFSIRTFFRLIRRSLPRARESISSFSGRTAIPRPSSAALIKAKEFTLSQTGTAVQRRQPACCQRYHE